MIKQKVEKLGNRWVLYNPELLEKPVAEYFSCSELQRKGLVVGSSDGRGETCFYKVKDKVWALRHYLRGGLVAKVLFDRYFGVRLKNSRAWKEWNLLSDMINLELPVPVPVAASVIKHGFFYQADLVTEYIEDTHTMAEVLSTKSLDRELWKEIGICVRKFHNHSVFHSDLNAKNILLDKHNTVYLIDFDRCDFKNGEDWKQNNLQRLKRSLVKFKSKSADFNYNEACWEWLVSGYQQ